MKKAENNRALSRAYALLRDETPLGAFNCGELCSARCCGGDDDTGMWLFPHEAEYLIQNSYKVTQSDGNFGFPCAVCPGECKRDERPLACRFFPLFPLLVEEKGRERIVVISDPRAGICPLTKGEVRLSRQFIRAVRRAGKCLIEDDEIREYMKKVSGELREILELQSLLTSED